MTACNFTTVDFPSDASMLEQWKRNQGKMLSIANECMTTKNTYSFINLYGRDIPDNAIFTFQACKLKQTSALNGDAYQLLHTARDIKQKQVLFVTSQNISKERWWIWEEPILEEKGFVYVSQDKQLPINFQYQPRDKMDAIKTGLDQFVGDLKLTKDPRKIDSCELWMFRPIAPKWYLFYRQNRGCLDRGL